MKIIGIASKTYDNSIGYNNDLIFTLKNDIEHFKNKTSTTIDSKKKNAVLMGKNTFLSIPEKFKPLKDRINIVISDTDYLKIKTLISDSKYENTFLFNTISQALHYCYNKDSIENLYVIGGEKVYTYFIENKLFNTIYLTEIQNKDVPKGDIFFPELDKNNYKVTRISNFDDENCLCKINKKIYDTISYHINKYDNNTLSFLEKNIQEHQYLDIIKDVLETGELRKTRNAQTMSKFGLRMEFDISRYIPLLTTKKVYWKGILYELLWFINGQTDAKQLSKHKVNIWKGNSNQEYLDSLNLDYEEGVCGPIYGFQWRYFNATYEGPNENYLGKGVDQLQNCIDLLNTDPTSRRIFMTAWNPCQLKEMVLPPCHVSYQFYVRADKYIDCQMYQRSGDLFLGVPFNIASTALLTHIVSTQTKYKPGKIVIVLGDAHIYQNHMVQIKEQLSRVPYQFPILTINKKKNINDYIPEDFNLESYYNHPTIKASMIS